MATNLRLRDVHEGDVLEVDGKRGRVSCALILEDDVILILDDDAGRQRTVAGTDGAVRLISRPVADTIAGPADTIISGL